MTKPGVPSKAEVLGDLVEADAIRKQYQGVGLTELSPVEEAVDKGIQEALPPIGEEEGEYVEEAKEEYELEQNYEEGTPEGEEVDEALGAVKRIREAQERGELTAKSPIGEGFEGEEEDCEPCDLAEKAKIENVCKLIPDEEKRDGCLKAVEEGRAGGFERGDLVEVVAEEVGRETFREAVRSLIMNIAGALPPIEEIEAELEGGEEEVGEQGTQDYSQTE